MFYYDWKLALVVVDRRAARRLSARPARPARAPLDAPQPGTARASVAPDRRGLHRPSHRQGVRRASAHEAERFAPRPNRLYRTNLKITSTVSLLPPIMEFLGGVAIVALLWYGRQRIGAAARMTQGQLPGVHLRGVHALHADQAPQPRQRQPPAGDRGGDAHLRDARHALGGASSVPARSRSRR